jgi:hypothetical protein
VAEGLDHKKHGYGDERNKRAQIIPRERPDYIFTTGRSEPHLGDSSRYREGDHPSQCPNDPPSFPPVFMKQVTEHKITQVRNKPTENGGIQGKIPGMPGSQDIEDHLPTGQ